MKAAIYYEFKGSISIEQVRDPTPSVDGVVIKVGATGICRSDWHGWMGHDSDIKLPHVPGHELAGTVVEIGKTVKKWRRGDRVTLPFVCGCGHCSPCQSGNEQICDNQFQPGFTAWGSFAEYVAIDYAHRNLVRLPDTMDFTTAASLGCRFITSFRALVDQGKIVPEQWVAIHGCGGVGLSAIMIAKASNAYVVAIDIDENKLLLAKKLGADMVINARSTPNVPGMIKEMTQGGAHISIDALGSKETAYNSIASLRKQGKHIQIGLMAGDQANPEIPMGLIIANELEVIGSHGMQAHRYDAIFQLIKEKSLNPADLVTNTVTLETGVSLLTSMHNFETNGIAVINEF